MVTKELISPSGLYKASFICDNEVYIIELFVKKEDIDIDISYGEYWSRISDKPKVVNSSMSPEYFAIKYLREYMEISNTNPTLQQVKDYAFIDDVELIYEHVDEVYYTLDNVSFDEIDVETVIRVSDYFLVREVEDDGWQLGVHDKLERIICHTYFENIKIAIECL